MQHAWTRSCSTTRRRRSPLRPPPSATTTRGCRCGPRKAPGEPRSNRAARAVHFAVHQIAGVRRGRAGDRPWRKAGAFRPGCVALRRRRGATRAAGPRPPAAGLRRYRRSPVAAGRQGVHLRPPGTRPSGGRGPGRRLPGAEHPADLLAAAGQCGRWLNWLTRQQVPSLDHITQDHCDRYLAERRRRKDKAGQVIGTLSEGTQRAAAAVIIDLAAYGELFTADRYHDGFTPWQGRAAAQVVGLRPGRENKTPPLDQHLLQPLLAAAFYLTETLGPHVLALRETIRQDHLTREGLRTARPGIDELEAVLRRHIELGEPLEAIGHHNAGRRLADGWAADDPLLHVSYGALARAAGATRFRAQTLADARPAILAALGKVGAAKPWGRDAAVITSADNTAAIPWTLPLDIMELRHLTGLQRTSALVITSGITGMRSSELMELRAGCRRATVTSAGMTRYRLAGKLIKGQGAGGTADEWVVIEEVDRAVALAEQLSDDTTADAPVFGRFAFATRYPQLRAWVNGPAGQRLGLAPIPDGIVNPSRLRRTLAIELAYRPGGLLAAKIHLKHVSAATTEGYSARPGGAQAKLLAEIGKHEGDRNLNLIRQEFVNYQNGIQPAGPGARQLTAFFESTGGNLAAYAATAPNVAATDQHLMNLLSKRAGVLHLGAANYCWFTDPSRALCLLQAGTPGASTPLIGMCDSARCPQATHHPCHRRCGP